MPWYAAHAILYFELTDGPQDRYQVYENVFLVRAGTPDEGFAKARALARRNEGDDSGSLRVGDRPARRVFAGIRKLITVSHESPDDQLGDGDEVTYSELVVLDREALRQLVADEDVDVLYIGRQDAEPGDEPCS
ncbi:MAG: DUF4288 domain-containing protein [Gemmataceae bacterium]